MSTQPAPPRISWGFVTLLASMTALSPLSIDTYLPSLPAMAADLHSTEAEAQGTVAAFLAGMAIGQLFYGPASDRLGRRPPVLLGTVIFVAASLFCALAPTMELLTLGRLAQALGGCAGAVIARAIVRDRFDHTETARMLTAMQMIMGIAPILAPMLGGVLLALGGWRLNFWALCVYGVGLALAVLVFLRETRSAETEKHARSENALQSYGALLIQPRLLGYALAGGLNGATLFAYITASPSLLIGTYGISPGRFGLVFGANALGLIGAGSLNRLLLRRLTPDQVLIRAGFISLAAAAALAVAAATGVDGPWTVLPLLFVVLANFGLMQGNAMAGALNVDPRRSGAISALMGSSAFGMGALAAAGAGAFHDGTPRPLAFTLLAAIAGSVLALHTLALRRSS